MLSEDRTLSISSTLYLAYNVCCTVNELTYVGTQALQGYDLVVRPYVMYIHICILAHQ